MVDVDTSANRKEVIIDAAEQVFSKFGYDASRVDDIAQTAGVAKGTIYLYFQSKQDLFISLVERRIGEFEKLLEKELLHRNTAHEVLNAFLLTRVGFYKKHLGMVNMLFQRMGQFTQEIQRRLTNAKENIKEITVQSFGEVLPKEYPIPPETLHTMISGSVDGLVIEKILRKKELNPQEIAESILYVYIPSIERYQNLEDS